MGKAITDLKLCECRYPVEFRRGRHVFCAEPTPSPLEPYCPRHRAIAYQPAPVAEPAIERAWIAVLMRMVESADGRRFNKPHARGPVPIDVFLKSRTRP